ncbi:T9SS type A sorting domain-containing protein [Algoriella sp.]|uniref:T9SS type A sorting domain-containing protein n=1 Tax=Algoriella sp. TaxID=1872434 RepID=UPI001B0866F4|nr:T9SS type A sorting domain-containing protein [Algoriella sp.]MBO6213773.1 T9SS type A sorting domain-containing protein [Algoriella sp.]
MTASGLTGSATPGGKSSENNTDINTNVSNINSANPGLYQLGLQVTNQQGTHTNNVYFAAVDANVTGNKNGFELEFDDFGSDSGFWLNQENTDGTTDDGSHLYINGFNMNDYVAKPLRLTFYKNPEDSNTTFSIGANLAEGSTLNDGLQNFSNGNKYYFVDTKENKTFEVNKDFSYTFTANESSNDRFVVYWNELPAKLGTDDNIVNKNKTFVYKNNTSSNSVRFAKNNLTANITLYNMTGQKLFEKGNVSTSKDFDFSNIENGMYIINIEYSDNTIETLKSIFKK